LLTAANPSNWPNKTSPAKIVTYPPASARLLATRIFPIFVRRGCDVVHAPHTGRTGGVAFDAEKQGAASFSPERSRFRECADAISGMHGYDFVNARLRFQECAARRPKTYASKSDRGT
jgi:hypothetical protein